MRFRDSLGLAALRFFGPCLCLQAACAQQPAPTPPPIPESHPLHGHWEGAAEGSTVKLAIEGNSLYFYERPDHQFDTTFALIPDTDPQELRATILDSPRTSSGEGEVVVAVYEFEDGVLRLAAVNKVEGEPASFDGADSVYRLVRAPARE